MAGQLELILTSFVPADHSGFREVDPPVPAVFIVAPVRRWLGFRGGAAGSPAWTRPGSSWREVRNQDHFALESPEAPGVVRMITGIDGISKAPIKGFKVASV